MKVHRACFEAASLDAKEKSRVKHEKNLNTCKEDLSRTQSELDAAMDYHAELKTST